MAVDISTERSGAGDYPATRFGKRERKLLKDITDYTRGDSADWASSPATVYAAIDALAAAFADLLAKLDADAGVTDTDYASTLLP